MPNYEVTLISNKRNNNTAYVVNVTCRHPFMAENAAHNKLADETSNVSFGYISNEYSATCVKEIV